MTSDHKKENHGLPGLTIYLGRDAVWYAVIPDSADIPISTGEIFFGQDDSRPYAEKLKEAVYGSGDESDCSPLASDYCQVTVVSDTSSYLLFPTPLADTELIDKSFRTLWPGSDKEVLTVSDKRGETVIAFAVDREVYTFLRRTFPGVTFTHALIPVIDATLPADDKGFKTNVYCCFDEKQGQLLMSVRSGEDLKLAMKKEISGTPDAAYYLSAAVACVDNNLGNIDREAQISVSASPEIFSSLKTALGKSNPKFECVPMVILASPSRWSTGGVTIPFQMKLAINNENNKR